MDHAIRQLELRDREVLKTKSFAEIRDRIMKLTFLHTKTGTLMIRGEVEVSASLADFRNKYLVFSALPPGLPEKEDSLMIES